MLLRRPDVQLVTVTGTGGIGKTRLSLQVASDLSTDFAAGVCFVPLASVHAAELVVTSIAQELGLSDSGDISLYERLQGHLSGKQLLLLLDNFEQVVEAASLLTELLLACPDLRILVTSRVVLHVRGEHEFPLAPLTLPDLNQLPTQEKLSNYGAVALFMACAQSYKPDFQITDTNARVIAEICARLDGLPLALELAAARIKLFSPQALLARLGEHRLQLLTGTTRNVPVRQQTLRNTLAWSYAWLGPQEQQLFRRLAAFAGGCTLEAVQSVCYSMQSTPLLLDEVMSLIDSSLLLQHEQDDHQPRLLMLETIREYARECLDSSEEAVSIYHAHALYFLALAEEAEQGLNSTEQEHWLKRLEQEYTNLRAALNWLLAQHEIELALRLGGALGRFWWVHGQVNEGRNFLDKVLAQSDNCTALAHAKALNAAGTLTGLQGNYDQAEALCEESLALFRAEGDVQGTSASLWMLGYTALQRSNYKRARMLSEEGLELSRKINNIWGITYALEILAAVAFEQGEYTTAHRLLKECLHYAHKGGDTWNMTRLHWLLALVVLAQGDVERARFLLDESLIYSRKVSDTRGIAYALIAMGFIAFVGGEIANAQSLFEESLSLHREIGDRRGIAWGLYGLGWIAFAQGNYMHACKLYEESLAQLKDLGDQWFTALCMEGLAGAIAARGHPLSAARIWGAASVLRQQINATIPPFVQVIHERNIAKARIQAGAEAFTAFWAEGQIMTTEQVLAAQEPALAESAIKTKSSTGLTAREIEVLRHITQGMTDIQVAEILVISPRTVSTHLSSIYNKLGVTTRAAATRLAIETGII